MRSSFGREYIIQAIAPLKKNEEKRKRKEHYCSSVGVLFDPTLSPWVCTSAGSFRGFPMTID